MRNLVIIGNGFDLAHGLKTGYSDYMRFIVEEHQSGRRKFNEIFDSSVVFTHKDYDCYKSEYRRVYADSHLVHHIRNDFFEKILLEEATQNWSDIERLYFKELKSCKDYLSVKKLNDEFDVIKYTLSEYLKKEEDKFTKVDSFNILFNQFNRSETTVLNFNYTKTVKKYFEEHSRGALVHIHGELENDENPMIFGYAATENEISELLQRDINDYLFNIKKYNYKKTGEDKLVLDRLSKFSFVDVYILGHSCGSSDRLILSRIFEVKAVRSINVFYYNDFYNYKKTDIGIDRIVDGIDNFDNKTDRFTDCCRMPQHDDPKQLNDVFSDKLKKVLEGKKKKYDNSQPRIATFIR